VQSEQVVVAEATNGKRGKFIGFSTDRKTFRPLPKKYSTCDKTRRKSVYIAGGYIGNRHRKS